VTDANGVPKWLSSGGVSVSTQTVGLYYPSQRDISRREQELSAKERVTGDQKTVLTPISPGRGTSSRLTTTAIKISTLIKITPLKSSDMLALYK